MSYVGNQLQSSQLTGQLQQLPVGSVLEEELNEKGAMFRDFLTSRVRDSYCDFNNIICLF